MASNTQSEFVKVDGVPTRYIRAGAGEAIILLHGIGMSADCFHRNIDDLAARREVFAIDMLGHGLTGYAGLGGHTPLMALARHVLGFMDALSIPCADFVGSSLGGGVAVYCHLLRSSAVRRCVAAGSSTPFVSGRVLGQVLSNARVNAAQSFALGTKSVLEQRLRNLVFDEMSVSSELVSAQVEIYAMPDRAKAYADIVDGILQSGDAPSTTPAASLKNVDIPVLVIAGADDPLSPLAIIQPGIERLPQGTLKIYERCGHFPFLEHPRRFTADVLDFLTGDRELNDIAALRNVHAGHQ